MIRKIQLLLLTLCSLTLTAQTTTFPYRESFTGCTSLPAGWDNSDYSNPGYSTTSTTLRWSLLDETLHFYGNNIAQTHAAIKSPLISLPSNADMTLTFRFKNTMACGSLGVYLSTDSGTTYLNNPLDTMLLSDDWADYSVSLAAFRGQTVRIVFYAIACTGTTEYYTDFYVDDIEIDNTPICRVPMNLNTTLLTDSSAQLNWTLGNDGALPNAYQLSIATTSGTTRQSTITSHYTTHIGNLSPNTSYTVTLRSDCSAESRGYSPYSTLTFRTLCVPQNLPFSDDFNSESDLPDCTFGSNASIYTDLGVLKLAAKNSEMAYFLSPQFSSRADSVEISFRLKRVNPTVACKCHVGIVTDPSDITGSFSEILSTSITSGSEWRDIRVNSSAVGFSSSPVSICIFIESGYNSTAYIDDLLIRRTPTCVRPENLTATNITANSSTISWTASNAASYRLRLIEGTDTSNYTSNTNSYTITGLTPNSDFRVAVTALCSASDSSDISPEISFQTLCAAASSPLFSEGFETSALPACWHSGWLSAPDTLVDAPFVTTSRYHHNGAHSLSLVAQSAGSLSFLSTLQLPITASNAYDVSLYLWRDMLSDSQIRVWASPSPTDTIGATLLGSISALRTNTPAEASDGWYNYQFPITASGNLYILIEGVAGSSPLYLDDLAVINSPSCRRVSGVNASATSGSSINLSWTPNGQETQWRVSAQLIAGGSATTINQTVTSPQLTLNNLSAGAYYNIVGSLRSLCSANDSSEAVQFNLYAQTPCTSPASLPLTEGFESNLFPPSCWSNPTSQGSDTWSHSSCTDGACSVSPHSGGYSAFASSHFAGSTPLLATSQFTLSSAPSELKFFMYRSAYNGFLADEALYVYLSADEDTLGATLLGVVSQNYSLAPAESSEGWFPYIFSIPQSLSGTRRVLFIYHAQGGSGCYIDDVSIRPVPTCADLSCSLDSILSTSVVLLSSDSSSSWQYMLNADAPVSVSSPSVTISNLSPLTSYQIRVRRVCGSSFGDWSDPLSFRTSCAVSSLPYIEDFETYSEGETPACITVEEYYTSSLSVALESSSDDYNHTEGGSRGLAAYTSNDNGSTSRVTNGPVGGYAYVHLEAGVDYEYSFFVHASASASQNYNISAYLGLSPDHSQMSLILAPQLVSSLDWEQKTIYFSAPATGDYYIGLFASAPLAGNAFPLFIDDISLREVLCTPPTSASVSSRGSNHASLSLNVNSGSLWEVAVSDTPMVLSASLHGNIYHNDSLTSRIVSLSGLTSSTTYYYTFRTVCPAGSSAWLPLQSFTTRCQPLSLPYSDSFEDAQTSTCWTNVSRSMAYAYSGIASLSLSAATAASPEFNAALGSYSVTAYVMSLTDSAVVSFGAMSDADDAATFESLLDFTIPYANIWYRVSCPFSSLSDPTARYVAMTNLDNSPIYIDDLSISLSPSCPDPSNLQLISATDTSVTISTAASSYIYTLTPVNGNTTSNTIVGVSSAATPATPTIISGLTPSTTYALYAASLCNSTDTSALVLLGYVNTACGSLSAPYSEDFSHQQLNTLPRCWSDATSRWQTYDYNGNRMLRLPNLGASTTSILRSPQITLPAGKSFQLSLDYSHRAYCGNFYIRIFRSNGRAVNLKVVPQGSADHLSSLDPGTMTHVSFDLSQYAGETLRIQLSAATTNQSGAIFVDNIAVSELRSCPDISSLSLTSLSDTSATISISDTCTSHTTWQYWVQTEHAPSLTTTSSITLNNLTPSTTYTLYVRAHCSSTDSSNTSSLTFTTTTPVVSAPYSTRFSDPQDNSHWRFLSLNGSDSRFVIASCPDALLTDTSSNALFVSTDDGNSFSYNPYHSSVTNAYRTISVGEGSYDFNISYSCDGGVSSTDYARIYLIPAHLDIPIPTPGIYVRGTFPSSCIALDNNSPISTSDGWQHISTSIDFTGRSGIYNLVFLWANDSTSARQTPLSVGYVSITNSSCSSTTQTTVTPSMDSAVVSISGTSSYEYRLSLISSPEAAILSGSSTSPSFTLPNLTHSTKYYLFVRNICNNPAAPACTDGACSVSPWSLTTFVTTCGANTTYPFYEDFASPDFPPVCWAVHSTATGINWDGTPIDGGWQHFSSTMATDNYSHTPGAADFTGYTGAAAALSTPLMHLDSAREYHLSFYMYRRTSPYATAHLTVYLSQSEYPDRTSIVLGDYTSYDPTATENAPRLIDIDLPQYLSGDYHILFEGHYVGSPLLFVDDVTVDAYPLCRAPLTSPTVLSTTTTTATVEVDLRSRPSARVAIAPFVSGQTSVADSIMALNTTSGTVTFSGLTPGTIYAVYARINCSDDNCSDWSAMSRAETKSDSCFAPDGLRLVGSAAPTAATVTYAVGSSSTSCDYILTSISDTLRGSTTQDTLTFSNLTSQRTYTLRLRSMCSDGDSTDWSTLTFTTLAPAAVAPYSTGFENASDNAAWQIALSASYNNFLISGAVEGHNAGNFGLYISNDNSSYAQSAPASAEGEVSYNVSLAYRVIWLEPGNYEAAFDWRCDAYISGNYGTPYQAFGRAFLAPASVSLVPDATTYMNINPSNSANLYAGRMDGSQSWSHSAITAQVTTAGYYQIVFAWYASNTGSATSANVSAFPLAIDNFSIAPITCLPPLSLASANIRSTSADILVESSSSSDLQYAILTVNNPDSITDIITVTPNQTSEMSSSASSSVARAPQCQYDTLHLDSLQPRTHYYIYVRHACSSLDFSPWRVTDFTTNATEAVSPYSCPFTDATENSNWVIACTGQTNYFIVGNALSNGLGNSLYITNNGTDNQYTLTTKSVAYAYRTITLDSGYYEVSADWRAYGRFTTDLTAYDYGRLFLLPASESITEGTPLMSLSATSLPDNALSMDNNTALINNGTWATASDIIYVPASGDYNIVAYWYNQHQDYGGTGMGNPPVAFDNISISPCLCNPVSLTQIASTDTSLTIAVSNSNSGAPVSWTLSNLDSYLSPLMTDTLFAGTDGACSVSQDTFVISGLSASTTYYIYAQALCGSDTLSRLTRLATHTSCGTVTTLPYCEGFESFDVSSHLDLLPTICWSALNLDADDNGYNAYPYYGFTDYANYVHTGSRGLMLYCSTTEPLYLVLPDFGDIADVALAFWYRSDSKNPSAKLKVGYLTRPSDYTSFVELTEISGGTSFARYSQAFLNAPAGARIAFRYTPGSYSGMYGTLDDIRVSRLIHADPVSDTICHGVPYVGNGFNVPYTQLHDGLDTLTRVQLSPTDNGFDSLFTTYLQVMPQINTDTYDTTCSAHPYITGEWNIPNPATGSYVHTFTAASGCDSTVTLYLEVLPASRTFIDTVCHGEPYTFHGRQLTQPGMYIDSALNQLGCMTIDTLYLMVMTDSLFHSATVCNSALPYQFHGRNLTASGIYDEQITGEHGCPQIDRLTLYVVPTDTFYTETICQGGDYLFIDTLITTPGTYTRQRISTQGCYITHHLTLSVNPIITADIYDNACEGHLYYGNGISGLNVTSDTIVDVTTQTADLCDSLTHVHITYSKTTYTDTSAAINTGETFTWYNQTYSQSGDYTETLTSLTTGCDSIVTLHLYVKGTGIEDAYDIGDVTNDNEVDIKIVPNPAPASTLATLYLSTLETLETLETLGTLEKIDLLSPAGTLLSTFIPSSYPISLLTPPTPGIYYIRLTLSTGTTYTTKLIVK